MFVWAFGAGEVVDKNRDGLLTIYLDKGSVITWSSSVETEVTFQRGVIDGLPFPNKTNMIKFGEEDEETYPEEHFDTVNFSMFSKFFFNCKNEVFNQLNFILLII